MNTKYRVAVAIVASFTLCFLLFGLITAGPASLSFATPTAKATAAEIVQTFKAPGAAKSQKNTRDSASTKTTTKAPAKVSPPVTTADITYFKQFKSADAAERMANAKLIVAIGNNRGLSDRTIAVAVAVAIQESGLRNLDWGDADSLGLFQQRPSVKVWGTAAQILDRAHAINSFYDSIVRYHDRDTLKMITIAMYVQRPNPEYYYRDWHWNDIATDIVARYSSSKGNL